MLANRLKKELCSPDRGRRAVRITLVILFALHILLFAGCTTELMKDDPGGYWSAIILLCSLPAIYIIWAIIKEAGYLNLKKCGRLSYEFLKNNGLLEQAAAEYYGPARVECQLKYKGINLHRFPYRKNVLTPNFIFIMSDNAVLLYEEVKAAHFLELIMKSDGKSDRVQFYCLQMEDGTEIPIMSILSPHYFHSQNAYNKAMNRVRIICEKIRSRNPECNADLSTERCSEVSVDIFTYLDAMKSRHK